MLKWNISAKVTSLLLFICFVISATLGWIGYRAGKAALEANTLAHLTSINASKASQLSDHLLTIEHQIRTLSQDKTITEAMLNFGAAFEQLNAGAQQGPAGTSRCIRRAGRLLPRRLFHALSGQCIIWWGSPGVSAHQPRWALPSTSLPGYEPLPHS